MTKPSINLFGDLEGEFQNVQKSLSNIAENIKKITGNYPHRIIDERNRKNRFRKTFADPRKSSATKRKLSVDQSDDDEDNNFKRSLQSQILSTSWEAKHRNQVLEEQKNDKKTMSRNKRMFGMILGTLEKFKTEESQRQDTKKRVEIENKLDQEAEIEREVLKKEKKILFQERRIKRIQMKCLEQKMQRAAIHTEWEQSQQFVGNFIETKTKPHIFYMPVKHNNETLKRSKETKDKYRIILAEKRAKVQKELNEIDEFFKKSLKELGGDELNVVEKNGHKTSQIISNEEVVENHKDPNNNDLKDGSKKDVQEEIIVEIEENDTTKVDANSSHKNNHKKDGHRKHELDDKNNKDNRAAKTSVHRQEKKLKRNKDEVKQNENHQDQTNQTTDKDLDKDTSNDKDFEPIYD